MLLRSLAVFVVFTFSTAVIDRANKPLPPKARAPFAAFPMELDNWQGRAESPLDEKTLSILGVNDYLTRTYVNGQAAAGLYVGYWASQRQGDSIHSPLNCLPGAGWEPVSKSLLDVAVKDGDASVMRRITVNRYVVQKGLNRDLVLYWYQSQGRVVASEYLSKMYLVADAIRTHRTDAALVRVTVHVGTGDDAERRAERDGADFVATLFSKLSPYLPL